MLREYGHELAEFHYYTPLPFEKEGGLYPLRMGTNIAKPHYHIGPRFIEDYSIHYILEGHVEVIHATQNEVLHTGDLFCLFPKITIEYKTFSFNPKKPLKMIWFAFNGSLAASHLNTVGLSESTSIIKDQSLENVKETLLELFQLFKEKQHSNDHRFMLQSTIYRLFSKLASRKNALHPNDSMDWIQHSIDYIFHHYMEDISVEHIASHFGVHRSHFSSYFKQFTQKTPKQFITNLKMNKAARMLQEKQFTFTEIALSLGFSDLYSFSRAFRNYYGASPKTYKG